MRWERKKKRKGRHNVSQMGKNVRDRREERREDDERKQHTHTHRHLKKARSGRNKQNF
jgi:hypothetical protein